MHSDHGGGGAGGGGGAAATAFLLVFLFVAGLIYFSSRPDPNKEAAVAATSTTQPEAPTATDTPYVDPTDAPTPSPYRIYHGKVDDLPDVARDVLQFTPADSSVETNSQSIAERVETACGFNEFVGADDYPGKITVSPPVAHGWTPVTWVPGKCDGIGQGLAGEHPTLVFKISADHEHLEDESDAANYLTH